MKLHYRILWIDDQIQDFIALGIKDIIQDYIEELEFISEINCFETTRLAEEETLKVKYDLIISDFNIDNGGDNGDVLIRRIRSHDIFTEVLFYSAKPNFNQNTIGVDRISYFSLQGDDGYRGFRQKVLDLIDLTVAKLQELPSMRGLVMTETSALDSLVEDILLDYFSVETEESQNLMAAILKRVDQSLKSNYNKDGLKLSQKSPQEIVKSRIFDASKKVRSLEDLIAMRGMNEDGRFDNFYDEYLANVINVRNKLAHARSEVIDHVECLVVDGEEPESFNVEQCKLIRKNLKKFKFILAEIHDLINAQ